MKPSSIAIVGAAETTELGRIPELSQIQLHADAALNALADAGLKPSDVDGVASAGEMPTNIADYLGIVPTWVDGTMVGAAALQRGSNMMTIEIVKDADMDGTMVGAAALQRGSGIATIRVVRDADMGNTMVGTAALQKGSGMTTIEIVKDADMGDTMVGAAAL